MEFLGLFVYNRKLADVPNILIRPEKMAPIPNSRRNVPKCMQENQCG